GIQTVCWDQRLEPITPLSPGAGAGRGGGGQAAARRPVPGYPVPLPESGYKAENPCASGLGVSGAGGGGFGAGGGTQGPFVMPGEYVVALVSDGKVVDSKRLSIVMDPAVNM